MFLLLSVITGVLTGTIINYLADVLPVSRRFTQPICANCEHPFSAKEYLLSSNCPTCETKRSIRTFLVQIFSIAVSILIRYFPFPALNYWASIPILIFIGVIIVIDIEHRLVLIQTSIFGYVLFLIYGVFLRGFINAITGSLAGLLIMLAFYFLGKLFTTIVSKIRRQEIDEVAFGFGDVCLGTIAGLLVGWPAIIGVIVIAILTFAVFSIVLLVGLIVSRKYEAFTSGQPFTLFIILGTIVMLYF